MASKPKDLRLAKDDVNEDVFTSLSKTGIGLGVRRSNCYISTDNAVLNTNLSAHEAVLENIFDEPIITPRKKKEVIHKRKYDISDIDKLLHDSDDEIYNPTYNINNTGKRQTIYKSFLIPDSETIKMKLITESTEHDFIIGVKEKSKNNSKPSEISKKLRSTGGNIKCDEDALMAKHEMECKNIIDLAIPSNDQQNYVSQISKELPEVSPRKRPKQQDQQEFENVCTNENEMGQANQIATPPKKPKSVNDFQQTPKKNFSLEDIKSTPTSVAKRRINLSTKPKNTDDSSSKVNTRRNTIHNSAVNYKEWSSSDDCMTPKLDKEAKVVIDKLDKNLTKKTNRHSRKTVQVHESEESEIEDKMNNAKRDSVQKTTRSRSKSLQVPLENLGTLTYSPSKDMQKLNIKSDVGNQKSSGTLIFKIKKSVLLQVSNDLKLNVEKQEGTPRRSQRNTTKRLNLETDSNEENADSSDDYKEDEETTDSDEDSGNDSNEECHKFSRRKSRNIAVKRKNQNKITTVSMNTPTKAISRLTLATPTFDKHRRTNSIIKPSTPLQKARAILHVSVLPKSLPCREEQFNDIYSFLHARLSDGSGGCIYISGVPGTGKTATVSEVIRCLKKAATKGELAEFDFIDINGMKLSGPRQAYVQIWKQMTGETKTWEESHKLLQKTFISVNSKRRMTMLLVDELDLLCTKRQDVVYNLLDWPSKTNAKLIVVTIANTMDLPERILMGKVTSRLGLTRLTFPPYNFKQLEEIVLSRLKDSNTFGGETIELVSRKVAAVSGDARRALDICRRATEIAEVNDRELVTMVDVKQALDEMIASPKIQAIKHCSEMEKYFLQAVCVEVQRTGIEEVVFRNVYMQMDTLCSFDGLRAPNISEALEICARLGSWRLLLCDHSRMDIHQRLLLNVSTDDVYFATKKINA